MIRRRRFITERVNWEDFDQFENYKKYLPDYGEGDTKASQLATAMAKIVYRYFNDGDTVFKAPGVFGGNMRSYATWIRKNIPELRFIVTGIPRNTIEYKEFLFDLAKETDKVIDKYAEEPKVGSIYPEKE